MLANNFVLLGNLLQNFLEFRNTRLKNKNIPTQMLLKKSFFFVANLCKPLENSRVKNGRVRKCLGFLVRVKISLIWSVYEQDSEKENGWMTVGPLFANGLSANDTTSRAFLTVGQCQTAIRQHLANVSQQFCATWEYAAQISGISQNVIEKENLPTKML